MKNIDYDKMESISVYNRITENLNNVGKLISLYGSDITLKDLREYLLEKQTKFMSIIAPKNETVDS